MPRPPRPNRRQHRPVRTPVRFPPPQADCGRLRGSKRRPRKAAAQKPKPAETPAKAKAQPKDDPDKLTIEHKKLVRRAMLDAFRAISIDQMKEVYPS